MVRVVQTALYWFHFWKEKKDRSPCSTMDHYLSIKSIRPQTGWIQRRFWTGNGRATLTEGPIQENMAQRPILILIFKILVVAKPMVSSPSVMRIAGEQTANCYFVTLLRRI